LLAYNLMKKLAYGEKIEFVRKGSRERDSHKAFFLRSLKKVRSQSAVLWFVGEGGHVMVGRGLGPLGGGRAGCSSRGVRSCGGFGVVGGGGGLAFFVGSWGFGELVCCFMGSG